MREHHWFMRLIAVCCTIALLLSFPFTPVSATEAETGNRITATTGAAIKQGNTGYCYVYIDSLESLFSLDVTVYFDPATVRVTGSYNQVTTAMYDSSVKEDHVQYTYLFDGEGNSEKTQLFYFEYQVLSDAPLGESVFDVVVGEAYDKDLQLVPLSGSRCSFQVQQTLTNLSCSISGTSSVSTTVEQEFTLSYRFSKTAIASGSFVIRYDPELFALESLTQGDFLTDKMTDVNTALAGAIYVSFLGSAYGDSKQLLTLKFKTLKNVTQTAPITLTVTDLYDLNLNPISCGGYTTNVQLNKDLTYDENAAAMWLETAYDPQSGQLRLTVQLEAGAKLGAGDFVLTFDTRRYTYLSAQKEFSPTSFHINDKEAEKGILKFSIISLTDIVEATKVLTVQFSADAPCEDTPAAFDISGSGIADSLTNTVVVNFRGCAAAEPGHTPVTDAAVAPTCLETGLTEGSHCRVCQKILVAQETIPALGHDEIPHESLDPTCTEIGWEAYVTCSRCDYTTYVELPANGHSYSHSFCTVCGEKQPAGNSWDVSAAGDGSLTASLYPNPDGTYDLELTGSGDMCTWSGHRQVPWYGYAAGITQVRIPAGVTSLGAYAFRGFTHLEQLRFDAVAMTDLPYDHRTFLGAGKEGAGVQVIIGSGVTRIPAHLLDPYESANGAKLSEIIFEADSRCESIGNGAFQYATGFTGVTLPACLTSIESNAFYSCTDLKEINIPKQVSVIGESAFACCSKLERVELPEGLTELSGYVFYECTALREITLPEGVTAIGSYAFYDCAALQALTLPAGITAIGDYAFYGCAALQAVNLPQCLQTLGEYAFYNCTAVTQLRLDAVALSDLKNLNLVFAYCGQSADGITVTVGSGVTVLPAYLFYPTSYNNALAPKITQVRFEAESACVRISDRVFVGNSWLQTIALPAGLQSIGDNAFYGCTALQQIDLPEGLQSIGASTFNGCTALQEISLPTGMTSIGYRAFYGCTALQTADLPASLTTLSSEAFYGCTALRSVNLPESLTTLGSHAFYNCTALTQLRLDAVELGDLFGDNYVLAYCGRAADGITLTVGSGVTRIPAYLFCPYTYGTDYIPNLTKVIFEEGSACQHIGTYAFYYCTALRELELPVSLRTMGSRAFENCTGLTKLRLDAVELEDLASDNRAFSCCGQSGEGITVTVGSGVTKIPAYLFYPRSNTSYAAKLKAVVFEENSACRSIGNYAFCGAGMTELALPESLRTIGSYAFQRCTALQKVNLPASLQTIGYYAFYGCTALTQLRLDAVAMIDLEHYDPVFGGCGQNTDGLTVTVGSGVTRIPQKLFYATHSAPNFKAVIFEEGSSCESIGEQAFYYCDSLKQILLPTSVTSIGTEAFWGCNGLTVGFSGEALPEQLGDYWVANDRYYTDVQEMVMEGDSGYAILHNGTAVLTGYYGADTVYTVATQLGNVPVTTIGSGVFLYNTALTQVTIPEGITAIDNYAFYGCSGLNHILIPSSVTRIGHYAFTECYQLTVGIQAAQLPEQLGEGWVDGDRYYLAVRDLHRVGDATYAVLENGTATLTQYYGADTAFTVAEKIGDAPVTALGAGAFRYNTVLTTVLCPETVTSIGANAFYECTALREITLPKSLTSLGNGAFYGCTALETIRIDAVALRDLPYENYVFYRCGHSGDGITVTVDNAVTRIPDRLFAPNDYDNGYHPHITAVVFEAESVCRSIGERAFAINRSIKTIQLPDRITTIGSYAFYGCDGLQTVSLPAELTAIEEGAFYDCTALQRIILPENLTTLGNYAFCNCTGLTELQLHAAAMEDLGADNYALGYCGQSGAGISVTIGSGVTKIPAYLFDPNGGDASVAPKLTAVVFEAGSACRSIGQRAFALNHGIKALRLPDSITTIGDGAFYNCTGLTELVLPKDLTTIGTSAFHSCAGLTELTLPEGLTMLGNYAFFGCTGLTKLQFNAVKLQDLRLTNYVFYDCGTVGDGITVTVGSAVTQIPAYLFYPYAGSTGIPRITAVRFEKDSACQRIGYGAFIWNTYLEELTLPNSLQTIENSAFGYCSKLTRLTIPEQVTAVNYQAFISCTGLETVFILSEAAAKCATNARLAENAQTLILPATVSLSNSRFTALEEIVLDGVAYKIYSTAEHQWEEYETLIPKLPCQRNGLVRYHCAHCDFYKDVTVPKHTPSQYKAKAPDCLNVGWHDYEACADCGYTTYVEIPALGHCVLTPDLSGTVLHTVQNDSTWPFDFDGTTYSSTNKTDATTASVTVTALYDCTLEITYKVYSETNYDRLLVSHNGVTLVDASGEVAWQTKLILLTAGDTVMLTYSKDGSASIGEDTAWFRLQSSRLVETPADQAEPDCLNPVVCYRCKEELKAALGHDLITHEARAVTCVAIGWDAYETCSRCDYSSYQEIPADGKTHDPVQHEAKAPNCTEIGWDAYETCSRCDYTTYKELPALGHDEITHEAQAVTCLAIGWDAYVTCSRCDHTTYVEQSALGHDPVQHEAKAPNCTEVGWNAYETCSRCDYTTYAELPVLGHDAISHEALAPTCTEIGWKAYETCSRCDYSTYQEIPATGHSFLRMICTACGVKQMPLYTWDVSAAGDGSLTAQLYQNHAEGGYELELVGSGPMANYDYSNYAPWYYYGDSINWVGLPEGLTRIGSMAFQSFGTLRQIRIPASVVFIGEYAFSYSDKLVILFDGETLPAGGFGWADGCGCYLNPRKVILEEDATYVIDKDGNAILAKYVGSSKAFVARETVDGIPVTQIGQYAFYQRKLRTYWIPDAIEFIGANAFTYADGIALLFAEDSLPAVGSNWNGGNDYYLGATAWSEGEFLFVRDKNDRVDLVCYQGSEKEITVPARPGGYPLKRIRSYAFHKSPVEQVLLPEGIEAIGAYAFYESRLRRIHLPDSLTEIGDSGFHNCYYLEEILFPENLRHIGYQAFWYCTGLKEVTIPDTITNLNSATFTCCSSLEKVTLSKNLSSMGHMEFYGCTNLREIELPEKLYAIGNDSFWNTPKLKVVYVRSSRLAQELTSSDAAEDLILYAKTVVVPAGTGTDHLKSTYPNCETGTRTGMAVDVYSTCTHRWTTETVTEYVHCLQDGYAIHTCSLCGVQTDTVTPKHTMEQCIVEPTCTEAGYTLYSCPDCGESYKTAPVDKLEHTADPKTFLCTHCGGEAYLLLVNTGAEILGYNTWELAMQEAPYGSTIQLRQDIAGDVVLSKTVFLDLNGHSIDGTVNIRSGCVLYGTDSGNDDFSSFGTIGGVAGDGQLAKEATGINGRHYVSLTGESGISFHRWQLQLHTVTLRTARAGIYYKASLQCDDTLRAAISGYGVALSLTDMPGVDFAQADSYTRLEGAPVGEFTSGSVFNILRSDLTPEKNAARAAMKIYANAYLELADGTVLLSDTTTGDRVTDIGFDGVAYSLEDVLMLLDQQYAQLTTQEQQSIVAFLATWKEKGLQNLYLEHIQ